MNPLHPAGLNRFAYAADNPIRYSDPNGEFLVDSVVDVGFVIRDVGNFLGAAAAAGVGWATGYAFYEADEGWLARLHGADDSSRCRPR